MKIGFSPNIYGWKEKVGTFSSWHSRQKCTEIFACGNCLLVSDVPQLECHIYKKIFVVLIKLLEVRALHWTEPKSNVKKWNTNAPTTTLPFGKKSPIDTLSACSLYLSLSFSVSLSLTHTPSLSLYFVALCYFHESLFIALVWDLLKVVWANNNAIIVLWYCS